jgi:hypothetical protein
MNSDTRRSTSPARRVGGIVATIALVPALLVGTAVALRFTFVPAHPTFYNYGVVHTRIGTAVVACAGEAGTGCGVDTAIRFTSCSARFRAYFADSMATQDQLVRALIGKRPPSGEGWDVHCGGAAAMIEGQPLTRLRPP